MNLIILFLMLFSQKQDTLTLNECYDRVYEKYPNAYQKTLYESSSGLKLKNLDVNYLPQISFKGQATYQSDVPEISIPIPTIKMPEQSKDRYQLLLDVKQLIYDGGTTSSLKTVEEKQLITDKQKIEVELYSLRQKVNDIYFTVLLLQERKNINQVYYNDIQSRIKELTSKVENGVIPKSNLYILQAQLLQIEQELENIDTDKNASLKMLGELMEKDIGKDAVLNLPNPRFDNFEIAPGDRPEYRLFEYQKTQFDALKSSVNARIMPKLNVFGQAGYGRPGLNILDNSFQPFYTVGVNVSWNPINWNSNSNEKQIYDANKKIIDKQKETFDKNLKVSLEKYKSDIYKYESLLKKDEELISLREKIVESTASQLSNGTITSTVYLTELNNKNQVLLTYKTHLVQLIQSKINFLTTKGNKIYE
ncbi:MAG: TolC family protein [Ignavibacteria bacterium]|jgi:outer membrane protein TolC